MHPTPGLHHCTPGGCIRTERKEALASVTDHGWFILETYGTSRLVAILLLLNVQTKRINRLLQLAHVPPQHLDTLHIAHHTGLQRYERI